MPLSNGCNHVTVVTADIDRFIAFYSSHFDAEVKFDLDEDGLRHALVDLGGGFCLHPFQLQTENPHAEAIPELFARGHIDHFAIGFEDAGSFEEARRRLVEAGASKGRVRDFGAVQILSFVDPDGMECELALWKDAPPLSMQESRVEEYTAAG